MRATKKYRYKKREKGESLPRLRIEKQSEKPVWKYLKKISKNFVQMLDTGLIIVILYVGCVKTRVWVDTGSYCKSKAESRFGR